MKKEKLTIEWIVDYIIRHYPDSCLAINHKVDMPQGVRQVPVGGVGFTRQDDSLVKEAQNFFYYEKLKWCGCGNPKQAKRQILYYLGILDRRFSYEKEREEMKRLFGVEFVYDNPLLLCFAYAMDAAEFTEHGTSIGAPWLTEEGEMFLWLLEHDKEIGY